MPGNPCSAPLPPYLPRRAGHHHLGRVLAESDLLHAQARVIAVGIKAAHLREGAVGSQAPSCSCGAAPPVHPHVPPPAGGYQLRCTGCSGHHARERSVPTRPPALPPHWGRPARQGTRNKRPLCPHGASRSSCALSQGTRPQDAAGTAPAGASSVPSSPGLPAPGAGGGRGVLGSAATSPPPWGPHLAERWPLLLARLVEAVVLAVRLEDAGGAQLVEGLQGDPRGIPEPHRAVLVPGR